MPEQAKAEYHQLFVGFEFQPQSYKLDASTVSAYLEATRETNDIYRKEGLVPPMAVTAFAMAALGSAVTMPPGTIHVSQELDFLKLVKVGDTITCFSKVSRKQDRGGLHLMNTDITVLNQNQEKVLTGRVGFILPDTGKSRLTYMSIKFDLSQLQIGQNLPEMKKHIVQEEINLYAKASRDFNPIHIDEEFARKTPLGGTIAHGMLILAYVSQMMTNSFGKEWLTGGRLNVRFKAPARPGE